MVTIQLYREQEASNAHNEEEADKGNDNIKNKNRVRNMIRKTIIMRRARSRSRRRNNNIHVTDKSIKSKQKEEEHAFIFKE